MAIEMDLSALHNMFKEVYEVPTYIQINGLASLIELLRERQVEEYIITEVKNGIYRNVNL